MNDEQRARLDQFFHAAGFVENDLRIFVNTAVSEIV